MQRVVSQDSNPAQTLLTTHRVVEDILRSRVVVDVAGDAAQGADLGRQLVEPVVVLALRVVGVGHG